MEFKIGMRVMYRDTPGNNVYEFRPALPRVTGSVVSAGSPSTVGVRWDKGGLYIHQQSTVAYYPTVVYYRPDRLQPLTGGF